MKKALVLIGVLALLLIALVVWFLFGSQKPAPAPTSQNPGVTFPSAQPVSSTPAVSQGDIAVLNTNSDSTLQVKNPTKDPQTFRDPYSPDFYYLGYHAQEGSIPDPTAVKNAPYLIEYIDSTNYFNVVLLTEPLGQTRRAAEQYLEQHLGITADQLCVLKYTVSVPHWVNEQYTGTDLRFSSCSGATALPE